MTSNHLDDGTIQALLHGEVVGAPDRAHVNACTACRERLAAARREETALFETFEALDAAPPAASFSDIHGGAIHQESTKVRRAAWRWAAGVLLVIGLGGAAYAAPGSPLRSMVAKLAGLIRSPSNPPVPGPPTPAIAGGVLLDPGDGTVIELRSIQPSDSIVVFLTDERQIGVRTFGGDITFDSDVAHLSISNAAGVARIEVAIPRQAPRVEIVGGGRQLYLKAGGAITSVAADTLDGRHTIVLGRR